MSIKKSQEPSAERFLIVRFLKIRDAIMLDLLLVIPTLNEEKYIKEIIIKCDNTVKRSFHNYRIAIADGGSHDLTQSIVESLGSRYPIDFVSAAMRNERGSRILYTMSKYRSRLYFFVDADLAPSMTHFKEAVDASRKGYNLVLGSRYKDKRMVKRPILRKIVSRSYNKMINILFSDNIIDHQCGFRLFDSGTFKVIKEYSREKHSAWDTEMILIAISNKLRIKEIPIKWTERRSKHTSIKRLVGDVSVFIPSLVRMLYRFKLKNNSNLGRYPNIL